LNSPHHEGIPWHEFHPVEAPAQIAEADSLDKEVKDNYLLTVYQEIIKKGE
jgi:hypothetical protein